MNDKKLNNYIKTCLALADARNFVPMNKKFVETENQTWAMLDKDEETNYPDITWAVNTPKSDIVNDTKHMYRALCEITHALFDVSYPKAREIIYPYLTDYFCCDGIDIKDIIDSVPQLSIAEIWKIKQPYTPEYYKSSLELLNERLAVLQTLYNDEQAFYIYTQSNLGIPKDYEHYFYYNYFRACAAFAESGRKLAEGRMAAAGKNGTFTTLRKGSVRSTEQPDISWACGVKFYSVVQSVDVNMNKALCKLLYDAFAIENSTDESHGKKPWTYAKWRKVVKLWLDDYVSLSIAPHTERHGLGRLPNLDMRTLQIDYANVITRRRRTSSWSEYEFTKQLIALLYKTYSNEAYFTKVQKYLCYSKAELKEKKFSFHRIYNYTRSCLNFAEDTSDWSELASGKTYITADKCAWVDTEDSPEATQKQGELNVEWAFHQEDKSIRIQSEDNLNMEICSILKTAHDSKWNFLSWRTVAGKLLNSNLCYTNICGKHTVGKLPQCSVKQMIGEIKSFLNNDVSESLWSSSRLSRELISLVDFLMNSKSSYAAFMSLM